MKIKTFEEWEQSGQGMPVFLDPMDQVDEELFDYMGCIVSPQYCSRELLQVGEAETSIGNVNFFMSFRRVGDKYYYLGILPEFNQ